MSSENYQVALDAFVQGCERIIASSDREARGLNVKYRGPLIVEQGSVYTKLRDTRAYRWVFAVIDRSTGNVYRTIDARTGAINKKTAKVRGNIFDDAGGLENVTDDGVQNEPRPVSTRPRPQWQVIRDMNFSNGMNRADANQGL